MAVDMISQNVDRINKVSNQQTTTKHEEKKSVSKTVTGVSLVGLLALASVGMYLVARGRNRVDPKEIADEIQNQANMDKLKELKKQVQELKNKIKTDYLAKREASMNEWKKSEEDSGCNMLEMAIIKREHVETTKDCDKILDELLTGQMEHGMQVNENRKIVEDFSKKVKGKIQELSTDNDWIEFRNWRRNRIRMRHDKTLIKTRHLSDDDFTRWQLIDEVLKSKIDGEPTETLQNLGLSVDDAVKMIKEDRTYDVLNEYGLRKFGDYWWDIVPGSIYPYKLKIERLFENQGYYKYTTAKNQVNIWQELVDLTKKRRQMISERLNKVANEIRQSDDVKALKELNQQIAELSKQTS